MIQSLGAHVIRAVVVDVDDTLCLTEAACFLMENEILAGIGARPMTRDSHLATWGLPLLEALPLRSPGVDVAAFSAKFPEVYQRYLNDGRVDVIAEENLAALDLLASSGRAVMMLTSRTWAEVGHMLAPGHPLSGRLSAAYHADNTRFRKPDPRVFEELLAATGLPPRQCLYVGDSPGDALAAKGAGLRFVACLQSGLRRRDDFAACEVDGFIEAFPDVVRAVTHLEQRR